MKRKNRVIINSLLIIHLLSLHAGTQLFSQNKPVHGTDLNSKSNETVWISDNGDGTYKNPVIYADYSDPDVVRVGDDYYMTSSSFSNFPGLPILHSKDLVNWTIIGHAAVKYPIDSFNKPQHGNGIWAPSIRFHKGETLISSCLQQET